MRHDPIAKLLSPWGAALWLLQRPEY